MTVFPWLETAIIGAVVLVFMAFLFVMGELFGPSGVLAGGAIWVVFMIVVCLTMHFRNSRRRP